MAGSDLPKEIGRELVETVLYRIPRWVGTVVVVALVAGWVACLYLKAPVEYDTSVTLDYGKDKRVGVRVSGKNGPPLAYEQQRAQLEAERAQAEQHRAALLAEQARLLRSQNELEAQRQRDAEAERQKEQARAVQLGRIGRKLQGIADTLEK